MIHLRKQIDDESGGVAIIVACSLTVIIGLVALATDVGRMYIASQRVAAVADAAALSGAQFLPADPATAASTVQSYVVKNGIKPQSLTMTVDPAQRTVAVTVADHVSYTFARVLGQSAGQVEAGAIARVSPVSGYNAVVPLGVVRADWQLGDPVILKASPGSGGTLSPGNFGPLSLGGSGAASYENNLRNGYTGWIRVGDWLRTEPGNMAGPTQRALQARIALDPAATYGTVRKGSPRILIIPMLDSFTANGRGEVQIVGFAAFYLEKVGDQGNDQGTVYGRFLRYVVTGESDGTGADFATYTIKLTH